MGAVRWNTIAFHRSIPCNKVFNVLLCLRRECVESGGAGPLKHGSQIEFANMKLDRTFESHKHVYNIKYTIDS